ncbi:hypothetical protein [Flavobacterium sp.]|uniref:hypothetical protein n=1 Tax=Flavobacterium sp. TaxID=239 RepID=UPI0037511761
MDEEFKEMIELKTLKWFPFIGNKYFDGDIIDNRMLIVGESHYNDGTEESILKVNDEDWTIDMIEQDAMGFDPWPTKIMPNFHKAMFREDEFSKEDFWNLVSYYNFIQRPMHTIKDRPSAEDFIKGWNSFFDLIKITKPKICLFIGVSASNYLMSAIQGSGFECKEILYGEEINKATGRNVILKDTENNNEIKLIFIRHTSMFFSWTKWNGYLKNEMKSQIVWFENKLKIETKSDEYYNQFDDKLKQKLSDIHTLIDKEKINKELESVNGKVEFNAPSKSGKDSDSFKYKISINDITLFYEVVMDNCDFESYYYGVKNKQIDKLEKIKSWYTYYDNGIVESIAQKVTNDIIEIIHTLKE